MTQSTGPGGQPADPNQPEAAETPERGPETDTAAPAAGGASGAEEQPQASQAPPRAQAYVDPSIAAEGTIAALEAEISELKDKFVRAHAEMDNLRKRTEREKADTSKYAISKFAGDMLAVADNLQRALAAVTVPEEERDPQMKALLEGVELTEAELQKALERHGVRQIASLNAPFDPNFHQAVMEEENKDVAAGTVLRVFQEGYQIGDRVLRPSMVVVARGGSKPVKAAPEDEGAQPAAANDDHPAETGADAPGGAGEKRGDF